MLQLDFIRKFSDEIRIRFRGLTKVWLGKELSLFQESLKAMKNCLQEDLSFSIGPTWDSELPRLINQWDSCQDLICRRIRVSRG